MNLDKMEQRLKNKVFTKLVEERLNEALGAEADKLARALARKTIPKLQKLCEKEMKTLLPVIVKRLTHDMAKGLHDMAKGLTVYYNG